MVASEAEKELVKEDRGGMSVGAWTPKRDGTAWSPVEAAVVNEAVAVAGWIVCQILM